MTQLFNYIFGVRIIDSILYFIKKLKKKNIFFKTLKNVEIITDLSWIGLNMVGTRTTI